MSKKDKKEKETLEDQLEKEMEIYDKYDELKLENEKLKKQIKEQEDVLKNTQLQYLSTKNEFDSFSKRVQQNEQKTKNEIFEKIILKILPIIELFIISYEHLPKEIGETKRSEGLDIINKKINSFLQDCNIEVIPTIGEMPDENMHELIGTHSVEDKSKKGKIVVEVKKGYLLKYEGHKKTLIPAKVLIGE